MADTEAHRRKPIAFVGVLFGLLLLVVVWQVGPLDAAAHLQQAVAGLRGIAARYNPLVAVVLFAVASALAVPLIFLTIVSIVALGPLVGAATTLLGGSIGAAASFGLGRRLGADALRQLAGTRVNRISTALGQRGILAAIAMRLIPIAPFAVVNMVAGASHIRLRDFLVGSLLGMLPATTVVALFVDQVAAHLERPERSGAALLALAVGLIVAGALLMCRFWRKKHGRTACSGDTLETPQPPPG